MKFIIAGLVVVAWTLVLEHYDKILDMFDLFDWDTERIREWMED